jgi:hypothetical protein
MALKIPKRAKRILRNLFLAFSLFLAGFIIYNICFEVRIYFLNRAELNDIEKVNKRCADTFRSFINEVEDKTDWEVSVISGYRSKQEQIQLKRDNPRNASSKKSRHVMGRAIDINLYKRVGFRHIWLKKGDSKREWRKTGVTAIAAKYNILWGGSYRNYHDPVHFEIH